MICNRPRGIDRLVGRLQILKQRTNYIWLRIETVNEEGRVWQPEYLYVQIMEGNRTAVDRYELIDLGNSSFSFLCFSEVGKLLVHLLG